VREVDPPRLAAARSLGNPRLAVAFRPWLGLALVCAGFSLHPALRQTFWTREYLPNILQQAATNIVLAAGMTFVILTGGIDLSVGAVLALSGVTLGLTGMASRWPSASFREPCRRASSTSCRWK
jgi:ribose transport system permease protein